MIPIGVVASSGIFVSGGTGVPSAPVLSGTFDNSDEGIVTFVLNWTTPANNGSPITGFTVQYSTNNSTFFTEAVVSGSVNTCVVFFSSGNTRYYRVFATNAIGDGPVSNVYTAIG